MKPCMLCASASQKARASQIATHRWRCICQNSCSKALVTWWVQPLSVLLWMNTFVPHLTRGNMCERRSPERRVWSSDFVLPTRRRNCRNFPRILPIKTSPHLSSGRPPATTWAWESGCECGNETWIFAPVDQPVLSAGGVRPSLRPVFVYHEETGDPVAHKHDWGD